MAILTPSKAPNLITAPVEYDQQNQQQFLNMLRLYFNQLDNISSALSGDVGMGFLYAPYGAFEDTLSHTVTANTANAMTFNTTDYSNGITLVDSSKFTVAYSGVYNLQFSTQFQNIDNAPQDISIWLKVNGVDVAGSTGLIGLPARKGVGDPYHDIKGWNFFLPLNANNYVEIYWSTTNANVTIQAYAAGTLPTRPSTASNVATLTFVSALY